MVHTSPTVRGASGAQPRPAEALQASRQALLQDLRCARCGRNGCTMKWSRLRRQSRRLRLDKASCRSWVMQASLLRLQQSRLWRRKGHRTRLTRQPTAAWRCALPSILRSASRRFSGLLLEDSPARHHNVIIPSCAMRRPLVLPCIIMIACGVSHGRTRPPRAQISRGN